MMLGDQFDDARGGHRMIDPPEPDNMTAATVVPNRWFAALIPLGLESAGGVIFWHPDFGGVPGDLLPADTAVPVDLAGGPLPLRWDTAPAGAVSDTHTVGEVHTVWLAGGVVYVAGVFDLAVPGVAGLVAAAAAAGALGRLRVRSTVTDVRYGEGEDDEGGTDYMSVYRWRLAGVYLELEAGAGGRAWPAPVGEVFLLGPGDAGPGVIGAGTSVIAAREARVRDLDPPR